MSTFNPAGKTICILPRKLGLGGPGSFQIGLIDTIKKRGFRVTHNPLDVANSAVLIIGGSKHLVELLKAQRLGVKLVQRLNGMNWIQRKRFTGVKHFIKAEIGNLLLLATRHCVDRVVYQSEFAHNWWEREHGSLTTPYNIIHNGVDLVHFSPGEQMLLPKHIGILMVEGHYGSGYEQGLLTAIELLRLLNQRLPMPVELTVVGDVPLKLRAQVDAGAEVVNWLGILGRDDMPARYRSAHVLYSADVNAACPNVVVEAMACGLPVVGFDTGALKELVGVDAGMTTSYGGNVWSLDKPDVYGLADVVMEVLKRREVFSLAARKKAEESFGLDRMTDRYLESLLGD